jgi:hypothetical protein
MGINGNGYVKKRRGILEHLRNKKITREEYLVFDLLLLLANPTSGIWRGNATRIHAEFGGSKQSIQKSLRSLEQKKYIKRGEMWSGIADFFIDKYEVTMGPLSGKFLSLEKITVTNQPEYIESVDERVDTELIEDEVETQNQPGYQPSCISNFPTWFPTQFISHFTTI